MQQTDYKKWQRKLKQLQKYKKDDPVSSYKDELRRRGDVLIEDLLSLLGTQDDDAIVNLFDKIIELKKKILEIELAEIEDGGINIARLSAKKTAEYYQEVGEFLLTLDQLVAENK